MMKQLCVAIVVLAAFIATLDLAAQKPVELKGNPPAGQQPADQDAVLSIQSFSRLVLVDVVAKGADGRPVQGLTADDFELLEDGVPQKVVSFAHDRAPVQTPDLGAPATESRDFFTNQRDKTVAPPSIIVLDLLNTGTADRLSAREALSKFVDQRMHRGETVAVFVLGNKLELVQDFSRDKNTVADAVTRAQSSAAPPETRREAAEAAWNLNVAADGMLANLAAALARNEREVESHRTISRVNNTLAGLRSLARFGARHPGRKSLVWLSSGFPFFLLTDMGLTGFETEMRQTSNLLASAQVAVYPVDVRGLVEIKRQNLEDRARTIDIVDPKERVDGMSTQTIENAADSRHGSRTPVNSYLEAAFNFNQSQDTMKEVADLTGGTAYLNRNDIDVAIAQALDDNRDTYTLGYYPAKKDFNNRFRRLKVRLKSKEGNLRYRKGYYATGFSVESKTTSDLIAALENDPTVSPQIPLISRVNPNAPTANQPFKVELFVQGGHIHYTDVAARSAAFLDFAVVALGRNGTPIARTFRRGELKFNKEGLAKAERSGFVYSLPVNLPSGEYTLRAGVRDSFTGRIGTVEIPVVVK